MDQTGNQLAAGAETSPRSGKRLLPGAVIVILAAVTGAVWMARSGGHPLELGRPIDPNQAIDLAAALTWEGTATSGRLVISGQVGEVCRSAGCWFVLQEIKDGRLHEIFIDLKKYGAFTVRSDISGRRAVVSGELVGTAPDRVFVADGLRLE